MGRVFFGDRRLRSVRIPIGGAPDPNTAFEPSVAAGVLPKRSRENELGGLGIETETLSERVLRDSRISDTVGSGLMDRDESWSKKDEWYAARAKLDDWRSRPESRAFVPDTRSKDRTGHTGDL